ncbi:hypothetical protein FB451DRAFT_1239931 [Mycena latifolia]|nr:hypothetical protein FB451DRAFT_1239931 [Mycena latifolia]
MESISSTKTDDLPVICLPTTLTSEINVDRRHIDSVSTYREPVGKVQLSQISPSPLDLESPAISRHLLEDRAPRAEAHHQQEEALPFAAENSTADSESVRLHRRADCSQQLILSIMRNLENLTSVDANHPQNNTQPSRVVTAAASRSIEALIKHAQAPLTALDGSISLRRYLVQAERAKQEGDMLSYVRSRPGEDIWRTLEGAFIDYARAVTLITSHIPCHADYMRLLVLRQRNSLEENARRMTYRLRAIAEILVDRYKEMEASRLKEIDDLVRSYEYWRTFKDGPSEPASPSLPSESNNPSLKNIDRLVTSDERWRTSKEGPSEPASTSRPSESNSLERRITEYLVHILDSPEARALVRKLEGRDAQIFLDAAHDMLDRGSLSEPMHCSTTRRLMRKLAETSEKLPTSLFITGVSGHQQHPMFCGGFGDVFRASYAGKEVALKRIRTFS